MLSVDTETLGLCGPVVLYQYKVDYNKTELYIPWLHPVGKTLDLLQEHSKMQILGFNLTFDWFQLCKLNSMFTVIAERYGRDKMPLDLSEQELIDIEYAARDGVMLRPASILDLYLHAQKGPFQHGMDREPIIVRKVPVEIMHDLCNLLNASFEFDPVLFARRKAEGEYWKLYEFKNRKGEIEENFYNIVCNFRPSLSLKSIAQALGIVDKAVKFKDLETPEMPVELGFAPYAKALFTVGEDQWPLVKNYLVRAYKTKQVLKRLERPFYGTWVSYLKEHIEFWKTNELARTYATNDVDWLPLIWEKFDKPKFDDDDSVLAACVGAVRWHGYKVDLDKIKELKQEALTKINACPIDFSKVAHCIKYLNEVTSPIEKATIGKKTGKIILETLEKSGTPAGLRAKEIMAARNAKKELDLYDKLLIAERFHTSFKIIGTLSSRMSGADGLNPQAINRKGKVRSAFPLATEGFSLCLGDFSGQEVTIFEAISQDENLRRDLLSGKKIHGIFGTFVYPNMSYEEIVADKERYTRSKSALFAMLYGGEAETLRERLGVPIKVAEQAYENFLASYQGARKERLSIKEKFSPLRQNEVTQQVSWSEHDEYVESMYGFKRYFTNEFYCCRVLFDLSSKLLFHFKDRYNETVVRNEKRGPQKIIGAAMTSLYAAAFNIQGAVFRQAANHRIQSTGAQITKMLQRRMWELQPVGASKLVIMPCNIHDEVIAPCIPELVNKTSEIVSTFISEIKKDVPLLDMEWGTNLNSWGEK